MSKRDPMEALAIYYRKQAVNDPDELLVKVLERAAGKKQKLAGTACGIALGFSAALTLLIWASHSAPNSSATSVSAIARYQMINSGLAERHDQEKRLAR